MHRRKAIGIFVLAIFLALPLASAEWKGRGFYEPDTLRDQTDGFMFLEPDATADPNVRQVYFSVYPSQYGYAAGTLGNPNSAELGSAILTYPTDIVAVLGVWKDCNNDGYLGAGPEGIMGAYRSVLLFNTTICPPERVNPYAPGFTPVHNDGHWVREFLTIGPDLLNTGLGSSPQPDTPESHTNPWNIADETARIWADFELPESRTWPTCIALPYSRDNLESTGGFLRYADCVLGWKITQTSTFVGQETGQDGLRWDDAPRERPDQSNSTLNIDNPYGRESDASYVYAFDCDATPTYVNDPTTTEQRYVTVNTLDGNDSVQYNITYRDENGNNHIAQTWTPRSPPGTNAGGSAAGTINETEEGVGSCDRTDDTGSWGYLAHDIIHTGQEGSPVGRRGSDWWFEYSEGTYQCPTTSSNAELACSFTAGPPLAGLYGANEQRFTNSWRGLPGFVASRNPFVNRADLQPWGATYLTAYATVDPTTVGAAVPAATPGVYGSDHCIGTTPRDPANPWWECDPANWNVQPDGTSIHRPFMVKVGQEYNLRDIDCWDHSPYRGSDINLSLIGENVCIREPADE